MARQCAVCGHDSRAAIEQAILNGKAMSQVARTFGFLYRRGKDGEMVGDHKIIQRHRDQCMPDAYQRAMADRDNETGTAIAARLRRLDEEVDKVIEDANRGKPVLVGDIPLLDDDGRQVVAHDWRLLLAAVREGRANAELLAKLSGKVEGENTDLDAIRAHLADPKARRLLAELEALAAETQDQAGGRT